MTKNMRIAYCIENMSGHGGMEKIISQKASYLAEIFGHHVDILTAYGDAKDCPFPISQKVTTVNLGINFDYDKIKNTTRLRTRQEQDYLVINRDGKRKKLKKYFIDEKIPSDRRERILLLADGSHILWVIGFRISEDVKVTKHTKRILEIRVDGGEKSE